MNKESVKLSVDERLLLCYLLQDEIRIEECFLDVPPSSPELVVSRVRLLRLKHLCRRLTPIEAEHYTKTGAKKFRRL